MPKPVCSSGSSAKPLTLFQIPAHINPATDLKTIVLGAFRADTIPVILVISVRLFPVSQGGFAISVS